MECVFTSRQNPQQYKYNREMRNNVLTRAHWWWVAVRFSQTAFLCWCLWSPGCVSQTPPRGRPDGSWPDIYWCCAGQISLLHLPCYPGKTSQNDQTKNWELFLKYLLPILRLLSSKGQRCRKHSKPCHVGIHWIALAECSQMSTHVPGFQSFSRFFLPN